ncbi:MAG: hypothetical protein NTW14_14785 [bacterium]|nr:hypothetical protein [bacterium]
MKQKNVFSAVLIMGVIMAAFMLSTTPMASDYSKKSTAIKDVCESTYLVEVTHTPEQCLATLDEVKATGADKLAKWEWGCMAGNHMGYLIISAKTEADALNWVPASERSQAKVLKLNKFTVDQIAEFHKKMK